MRRASEHAEQCAVIDWWRLACHAYKLPESALFAIPNGAHLAGDAKGRAIKMANLKRAGLRPGIPDLCLAVPRWRVDSGALYVEMKRRPNKPGPEQESAIFNLRRNGYHVCICYSADEAIQAIKGYLHDFAPR